MSSIPLERHQYDLLMKHKSPMALRLNDARHRQIKVGDLVHYSGHNTIMDRERFKVIDRMDHPTIHQAVDQIKHSGLSAHDRIQMKQSFLGAHGPQAEHHPVVSLHLEPHPMPPRLSQVPNRLG
jgi:hypothetical protein